ncbi:MAG TPA: hypothetical protein DCW68_00570 [Rhodospirillaceae bacterium]|nr:hypothetical protein [Rhodospirillaceae bacterium]
MLLAQGLVAPAVAAQPSGDISVKVYDPIEPVNRFIFGFNDILDRILIGPVARAYHAVLPEFMQNVVRDFTRNLKSPLIMANEALQGDGDGFGRAFGRMMMNTTVGLGGLIDVAGMHGIPYESEDFGQTLGVWGVGAGPYLVLPVLGPSNLRDTAGLVVDAVADPVSEVADATQRDEDLQWVRIFGAIDSRARSENVISDLRRNSVDYYASMRSIYFQSRNAAIKDGAGTANIPDYDEETP